MRSYKQSGAEMGGWSGFAMAPQNCMASLFPGGVVNQAPGVAVGRRNILPPGRRCRPMQNVTPLPTCDSQASPCFWSSRRR